MGQTLPPLSRARLSYDTLLRGTLNAKATQIVCSPRVELVIHELFATQARYLFGARASAERKACAYCLRERDVSVSNCQGCGASLRFADMPAPRKLTFMGADVVTQEDMPENEIRFINPLRPELSGRLLLEM